MKYRAIIERIDAALEKAAFRQLEIRAIYLTEADHNWLDRALSRRHGVKGSFLAYRDHQIRRGKSSVIYSTHGVGVAIPKKLSARVEMKEAA